MTHHIVYVVRHAAAEKESATGDAARRLTPLGRSAFAALARQRRSDLAVTRILASPFARALETAELLAEVTGAPVEEEPDLASGRGGGRELLGVARRAGAGAALVGHNPEVQEAVALAGGGGRSIPPGTIAALWFDGGSPRLLWLASPANDR